MPYYPPTLPVPAGFQTRRIVLEPLRPAHVERDYAAVMESRQQLRLWSGSPWPADDFTLEDNLKDLQWHWQEHQERIAFTYTVLDLTRQVCLGCVYMRPMEELIPQNPTELPGAAADETLVRFWVRTSQLEGDLQQHLLKMLVQWLHNQWSFSTVLFETREVNTPQVQLFDAFPMQREMSLLMPDRGGSHLFYDPYGPLFSLSG